MEFQVNTVFEENGLEKSGRENGGRQQEGKSCLEEPLYLYKQTASCAGEYDSGRETAYFCKISNAVTSIIGKLSVKPKFIIAKAESLRLT